MTDDDASRTTPRGLWTDGKGMFDAAEALIQRQAKSKREQMRFFMPTYFLLGHGIELALKSVLLAHGSSLEKLKDIGHNLERAASRVVELKLYPLSSFVESKAGLIGLLNPYYSKKYFEYRVTGSMSPPATKELDAFLSQLLKLAEQQLNRSAPRQTTMRFSWRHLLRRRHMS